MTKLPVFDFNYIDPSLERDTVEMLKKLYAFYQKKHWGYDKLFHSFQRKCLFCNVVAGKAIVSSAVAGGITLSPIVFATLTAFGPVVKGVASFKKYDKNAERANFNMGTHKITSLESRSTKQTRQRRAMWIFCTFFTLAAEKTNSPTSYKIVVLGIFNFPSSPQGANKKAYEFRLTKDSGSDDYRSRIGFNLFPLALGYYTLVVEYFSPEMTNVSMRASATIASIASQTRRKFDSVNPSYTKTLVQLHHWSSNNPNCIYLYLHGRATGSTTGYLVVYGVSGYVSSVDSRVFDAIWVVGNGNMTMQAPLDMNGHLLLNPKMGTDLDLNSKQIRSGPTKMFRVDPFDMTMETDLDLGGHALYQPKLGEVLDLNGKYVIDKNAALFGGTDGWMTLMNDLNMNSYLILQTRLGGDLNLNDHNSDRHCSSRAFMGSQCKTR